MNRQLKRKVLSAIKCDWDILSHLNRRGMNVFILKLSDNGHFVPIKLTAGSNASCMWWDVTLLSTQQFFDFANNLRNGSPVMHVYIDSELYQELLVEVECIDAGRPTPCTRPTKIEREQEITEIMGDFNRQ